MAASPKDHEPQRQRSSSPAGASNPFSARSSSYCEHASLDHASDASGREDGRGSAGNPGHFQTAGFDR